jgi:hypothetical protein
MRNPSSTQPSAMGEDRAAHSSDTLIRSNEFVGTISRWLARQPRAIRKDCHNNLEWSWKSSLTREFLENLFALICRSSEL